MRLSSLAALVLSVLVLASCDTPTSDAFSLEVTVEDAAGRPVAGQRVALVFGSFGSGAAPPAPGPPAQRPAAFDVSPVYPTPWVRTARVVVSLDAPAATRVDLVDLGGAVVATPFEGTLGAGQTVLLVTDEPTPGAALPAGVYQLRVTAGTEVQTRTTVRTDAFGGIDLGRTLGVTAADGTLTTTDRTVAPALFSVGPIGFYNEGGGSIGTFTFPRSVRVVTLDGDGSVVGAVPVTLRDGRNRVTVEGGRP